MIKQHSKANAQGHAGALSSLLISIKACMLAGCICVGISSCTYQQASQWASTV